MTRNRIILAAVIAAVIAAIVVACSPRTIVIRQVTGMMDDGISAFERDDDLDLVEKAIPANIKMLEAMLASSPDDRRLITLLSRLYGSYTFGFVETRLEAARYPDPSSEVVGPSIDGLKDQVNRRYEKGLAYALQALEKSVPGATDAFKQVNAISPYLERLGTGEVAPLFWYGFNLGAWVNHNRDSIRAVSRAHVARKVMDRVIELAPAYNHGGAHLFLLAYFGSRSPMMGGSQEKARGHYQRLKQIAGEEYLLPDLFYGRFCMQQQGDRKAFVNMMQRIIDTPPVDSELALYNAIAMRRAGIYLRAVDRLFE